MPKATVWTVGELARKAGVTVRTLHHYDQLGILTPSDYTAAGYRLYGEAALLQLQQILTLKALGLPLEDIQRVLADPGFELRQALRQQKLALQARLRALQEAVETLEQVESQLEQAQPLEPELLFKMMEVIQMKQSQEWTSQFYTPEQLASLQARREADPDEASRGTQAWNELFTEIRQFLGQDPAGEAIQSRLPEWEARWNSLIQAFTRGDRGMHQSLGQVYAQIGQAPPAMRQWYQQWADVRELMDRAKAARAAQDS